MTEIGDKFAAALKHESLRPVERRVRVLAGSAVLADTEDAMLYAKRGSAPVVFVPLEDVQMGVIAGSGIPGSKQFERTVVYWDIAGQDTVLSKAAWRFSEPDGELAALDRFVAFDPDQVQFDMGDDAPSGDHSSSAAEAARAISILRE